MRLEKWALIAELTSSVAIIATLIILVVQVRFSAQVTLAANRQSVAGRTEAFLLAQATSPEIPRVRAKVREGTPLSDEEYFTYTAYLGAAARLTEESYLQYRDGYLEEEYWLQRGRNLVDSRLQSELARQTWRDWVELEWFDPEFAAWVNEALDERSGPPLR
jgi:hypothetical protein